MTLDFGELRSISRMRTWKNVGVNARTDWSDVDILTKQESGDAFVEIATGLATDNVNSAGWV